MRPALALGAIALLLTACAASPPQATPPAPVPAPSPTPSVSAALTPSGPAVAEAVAPPAGPLACSPQRSPPMLAYAHPRPRRPKACTTEQIREYVKACLQPLPSKSEGCDAFRAANASCFTCLDATPESPDRGPVIRYPGFYDINIGGCIALARAEGAEGCGRAFQLMFECRTEVCRHDCPLVRNDTTFADFDACRDAVTRECAAYDADSSKLCNGTFVKGDVAAVCTPAFEGESVGPRLHRIAEYFCGK